MILSLAAPKGRPCSAQGETLGIGLCNVKGGGRATTISVQELLNMRLDDQLPLRVWIAKSDYTSVAPERASILLLAFQRMVFWFYYLRIKERLL
jgi:hypothetical protein